jgi:hypothetical protein
MAYADRTEISVDRSITEIIALVRKSGAERIAQAQMPDQLAIQCFLGGRMLRFSVRLQTLEQMPKHDGGNRTLTDTARGQRLAQAHRQRARALLLVIKAKLESVESGVETFDEAFLANVVMPDGKTIAELTTPAIERAYIEGKQPPLLLPAY